MRTCSEVEEAADTDHLYVMSASERLPGIVKIGRGGQSSGGRTPGLG